jgi:hypothetical protein
MCLFLIYAKYWLTLQRLQRFKNGMFLQILKNDKTCPTPVAIATSM